MKWSTHKYFNSQSIRFPLFPYPLKVYSHLKLYLMPLKEFVSHMETLHLLFVIWFQDDELPNQSKPSLPWMHTTENDNSSKWYCGFSWPHFMYLPSSQQQLIDLDSFQINCTYQNRNKNITESWFCTLFQQFPFYLAGYHTAQRLNSPVFAYEHLLFRSNTKNDLSHWGKWNWRLGITLTQVVINIALKT